MVLINDTDVSLFSTKLHRYIICYLIEVKTVYLSSDFETPETGGAISGPRKAYRLLTFNNVNRCSHVVKRSTQC